MIKKQNHINVWNANWIIAKLVQQQILKNVQYVILDSLVIINIKKDVNNVILVVKTVIIMDLVHKKIKIVRVHADNANQVIPNTKKCIYIHPHLNIQVVIYHPMNAQIIKDVLLDISWN